MPAACSPSGTVRASRSPGFGTRRSLSGRPPRPTCPSGDASVCWSCCRTIHDWRISAPSDSTGSARCSTGGASVCSRCRWTSTRHATGSSTLCARSPLVDAVFAYNDEFALIVLQVLRDAGVEVPDDIAVMGCDNLLFAGLTRPSLTTMDFGDIGGQIADSPPRHARGPSAAVLGRWACRPSSLENRLRTEDALAS